MRTIIHNNKAEAVAISQVYFDLRIGDKMIVMSTLTFPEPLQRTAFELDRLASLITPIAARLARVAYPQLGRNARLTIYT